MNKYFITSLILFSGVITGVETSMANQQTEENSLSILLAKGPPDHAPAHGYRKKYTYRYYPDASVYFDVNRQVYFHLEHGNWSIDASLPTSLKLNLGSPVSIELDTDKPYQHYQQHVQQYPSSKKNKSKSSGKDKKKHKYK